MRVGKLTAIKPRGRTLFIQFQIDPNILPIPFEKIAPIRTLLDIRTWEMNRTHWAVKDEDLYARLRYANLLPEQQRCEQQRCQGRTTKVPGTISGGQCSGQAFLDPDIRVHAGNKKPKTGVQKLEKLGSECTFKVDSDPGFLLI